MFLVESLDVFRPGKRVGFEVAGDSRGAVFPAPADDGGQKSAADSPTADRRGSLGGIQTKNIILKGGKGGADNFAGWVNCQKRDIMAVIVGFLTINCKHEIEVKPGRRITEAGIIPERMSWGFVTSNKMVVLEVIDMGIDSSLRG